jgi:hypothetical protein
MTEREQAEQDVHPVATLLPWYMAGKLSEEEHRQVSDHLTGCPACRRELDEITWLRGAVGAAYAESPGPSPGLFRRVMAQIETEDLDAAGRRAPGAMKPGFRGLFAPRWWPVLASGLIIGQFAILLWLLHVQVVGQQGDGGQEGTGIQRGPVLERSVPGLGTRLQVSFQPDARDRDIQRVLKGVSGRIVDGPLPNGFYVVELPVTDPDLVGKLLQVLTSESGVVRVAESTAP